VPVELRLSKQLSVFEPRRLCDWPFAVCLAGFVKDAF